VSTAMPIVRELARVKVIWLKWSLKRVPPQSLLQEAYYKRGPSDHLAALLVRGFRARIE
jgi:hypothetical protein